MTRVRLATAPTGFLRISGARTYIFSRLFARQGGGQAAPRIDDSDIERSTYAMLGVLGKERVNGSARGECEC